MRATVVRDRFVDFYQRNGFCPLPRSSTLHPSIPMTYVMSAGLVQVEAALAQQSDRSGDRFVLVQDCFRHFDLKKVGTDDIHLSFFEMPAAFIFDTRDRARTIQQVFTFARSVLGMEGSLWVSYFGGGRVLDSNLPADDATRQAWIATGMPENRVIGLGPEHNYWVQGNGIEGNVSVRKAGPHTELFYERKDAKPCSARCTLGCKCGRFVEFSNTLFVSEETHTPNRTIRPKSEPFIETVIGSERAAMILQNAPSVFDTEIYRPLIQIVRSFASTQRLPEAVARASERVIADHLRALCFLVADGAPPPGKNGRERIIKLLIRAVLTRQILFNISSAAFLPALVNCVADMAHGPLNIGPDEKKKLIEYFASEAQRFSKTVQRGYSEVEDLLRANQGATLSGVQIVAMEKERGLPALLIQDELTKRGLAFLGEDYREALGNWRQRILTRQEKGKKARDLPARVT